MSNIDHSVDEGTGVATITLNNPAKMNALSTADMEELNTRLHEIQYDESIRCVTITGAGDAFCSGIDLDKTSLPEFEGDRGPADHSLLVERRFHEAVLTIMRMKKPVIAKVTGPAAGAGVCLATACDFVYANENGRFGWIYLNVGVTIDAGVSFILPRLIGMRPAMELLVSGELISAEEASDLQLINEVRADDLDEFVENKEQHLASLPTVSFGETKRLMLRGSHLSLEEALDSEARSSLATYHSYDRQEGQSAFREGRDPEFKGR